MEELYVTRETLIGEIVNDYPEAIDVLFAIGMHCIGCPASQGESIEEAAQVHGLDTDQLVNALNEALGE